MNGSLCFDGTPFKVLLWIPGEHALFESLTQLSFCLPGYLFENDSRLVPEKFEGEPAVAAPALHTQLGEIFSWVTAAIGGKP